MGPSRIFACTIHIGIDMGEFSFFLLFYGPRIMAARRQNHEDDHIHEGSFCVPVPWWQYIFRLRRIQERE